MANETRTQERRIDQFFSGPGARADSWRFMADAAKAWSDGSGSRDSFDALLAEIGVTEEYHGYPGLRLMTALKEVAASGDASATATLRPSSRLGVRKT
jgi:arginine decarboxylase